MREKHQSHIFLGFRKSTSSTYLDFVTVHATYINVGNRHIPRQFLYMF